MPSSPSRNEAFRRDAPIQVAVHTSPPQYYQDREHRRGNHHNQHRRHLSGSLDNCVYTAEFQQNNKNQSPSTLYCYVRRVGGELPPDDEYDPQYDNYSPHNKRKRSDPYSSTQTKVSTWKGRYPGSGTLSMVKHKISSTCSIM
ncbi:hypothetical protein ACOME3_009342 [Neoechinorhynchus agilis]